MGKFFDWFGIRKKNVEDALNDSSTTESEKTELKRYLLFLALDVCANFIAKQVSQSEFKTKRKNWYYMLNVRPNTDMSATQFWERFTYELIVKNRVLVIKSDSDDLLIADSWVRNEYALYEDTFEGVSVKGYQFNRRFKMNEVIYLEYSTRKLDRAVNGLFEDYSDLFTRLAAAIGRNGQIRGTLGVASNTKLNEEERTKLNQFADRIFKKFDGNAVAVVPLTNGFEYKEHTNTTGTSNINVDELTKLKDDLVNTVADVLGIPTALLHGNRAELKDNITAFHAFCLAPLLKKIENELNAKTVEPQNYSEETRIEVVGINKPDMFNLAEPIDKLISSGTYNPNEIRAKMGDEPREGGDEYVRTKNYETTLKGGEEK